jgi:hypothetical protein
MRSGFRSDATVALDRCHPALEGLRVFTPREVAGLRHRVGEHVVLPGLDAVKDCGGHVGCAGLGDLEVADHVRIDDAGEDPVHGDVLVGELRAQCLRD